MIVIFIITMFIIFIGVNTIRQEL